MLSSRFPLSPSSSRFPLSPTRAPAVQPSPSLSTEQQRMVDVALSGRDVIVDATVGSGKTTSIQALCATAGQDRAVLYLTYSKLLKLDAQRRVGQAKVQNYHGIVYPALKNAGIRTGISESIRVFNDEFKTLSAAFPRYDLLVVDEYQDINEDYAQLLRNIKSVNPLMQTVMVGDMAQKVQSNTTLDAQRFAAEFCDSAESIAFTQSFRVGPELGDLLGMAWNKPVVGMNHKQKLSSLSYDEALELILTKKPGELLCLGKRNGRMSEALNEIEKRRPDVFNKNTVYASIRDGDTAVTYGSNAAVFTTFDASKGLEREVCFVFDFDEQLWDMRNKFPDADPVVLRNVFLVAASRGKGEVVFVRSAAGRSHTTEPSIGEIPVRRFVSLPRVTPPVYKEPWLAGDTFDFKYAENVEACFALLNTARLDDGMGEVIQINRNEGLIDLSPAVGHYQEAVFFDDYSAKTELMDNPSMLAAVLRGELSGDVWKDTLILAAVDTDQMRYADQVTAVIPEVTRDALVARLATQLPRNCASQVQLERAGKAVASRDHSTPIMIKGVADAVHDGKVFELKFVTELSHVMFLQLALYLVLGGYESGVLWNTRTDERWAVSVPDEERFMNAVVLCVTKQHYKVFAR
jgi:hypothetical protein